MVEFIRLRGPGDFWVGAPGSGFIAAGGGRTASQLLALREAARMVPNCAQPIILAYGTCASVLEKYPYPYPSSPYSLLDY